MLSLRPTRPAAFAALLLLTGAGLTAAQPHHAAAQPHPIAQVAEAAPGSRAPAVRTVLGEVVPVGDGTGRSWVEVDAAGRPTRLGLTLTETALSGLPTDITPGLIWMVEYLLAFPSEDSLLPFDHIGLNWNPRGHSPNGIYNVPHFDVHFYTISPEARTKITARGADLDAIRQVPPEGYMADGFIFAPESEEPGMGGHWADTGSHEFHGKDFTSTFIYGTYDGEIIFYEPMITKAYLESQPDVTVPFNVPRRYARAGYYPTAYSIRYDPQRREYTVALENLVLRTAD